MKHNYSVHCLLLLLFHIGVVWNVKATVYPIENPEALNRLKLIAGDTVMMMGAQWKDAQLNLRGEGTESAPIVLIVNQPGQLVLSGNSNLKIDGHWLVVNGLFFTNGFSLNDDVIIFSKTAAHCRITNTAIVNYNPPKKETDYKWLSLYGSYNSVDHCTFTGKNHQGTTLVVWLSDTPNHHTIQNNYFGARPPLGGNGGESIRIGTSEWSMHDSYALVQHNIFDKCDGETEIISVKSGHNLIKENLFYECDGTLTLRHGNNNTIDGNYFIGNDKKNTGGIRVIGENHVVENNYLYKITGDDLRAAISVMNAFETPKLNEYWQVKNALIKNNFIIKCNNAFVIGSGKNDKRVVAPESVTLQDNYVLLAQTLMQEKDSPAHFTVNHNKVMGSPLLDGFSKMAKNDLQLNHYGIWVLRGENKTPFWINEKIGTEWGKKPVFSID